MLTVQRTHAVLATFSQYPSFVYGPLYNAYETRTTQACNTSITGCCSSGTVLTQLVKDTGAGAYKCYMLQFMPNDMKIQVWGSATPACVFHAGPCSRHASNEHGCRWGRVRVAVQCAGECHAGEQHGAWPADHLLVPSGG